MDERSALLGAVMFGGSARDKEAAIQVDGNNRSPVILGHFVEDAVAQNPGIVHHRIDPAKMIQRGLDDFPGRAPGSDGFSADFRLAATLLDQRLGLLRRGCRSTLAVQRCTDIRDDDLGAGAGHHDRDLAADAAAGAGYDSDFAFHQSRHVAKLLWVRFVRSHALPFAPRRQAQGFGNCRTPSQAGCVRAYVPPTTAWSPDDLADDPVERDGRQGSAPVVAAAGAG